MARVSVAQAASRLGVNVQRVHQRIADGSLPAERIGHQWVVDDADLARLDRRPAGRPLSPKSAWTLAVVAALDVTDVRAPRPGAPATREDPWATVPPNISPAERSRARARLRELLREALQPPGPRADQSDAAKLAANLRSLLRNRAARRLFRASPRDLAALRSDDRINLSGVSLAGSGIASSDMVEGYVAADRLDDLVDDYLLSDAGHMDANVVLHVVDPAGGPGWGAPLDSWLLLAADLAEYHRPRESARAAQIVQKVAEHHPALTAQGPRRTERHADRVSRRPDRDGAPAR
jgi:hypothetical protein